MLTPSLVIAIAASFVACLSGLICLLLFRALLRERAKRELTPADLRALESAAAEILEQLKQAADEAVAKVDSKIAELRALCYQIPAFPEEGRTNAQQEQDAPFANSNSVQDPTPGETPSTAVDETRARVFALADQGLDTAEIARQTGIGMGEVELLLDLCSRTAVAH
jgi:hypothetical protein